MPNFKSEEERLNLLALKLDNDLQIIDGKINNKPEAQQYRQTYDQMINTINNLKQSEHLNLATKIEFIEEINKLLFKPDYIFNNNHINKYPQKSYENVLFWQKVWHDTIPFIIKSILITTIPAVLAMLFVEALVPAAITIGIILVLSIMNIRSPSNVSEDKLKKSVSLANRKHDAAKDMDFLAADLKGNLGSQSFFFNTLNNQDEPAVDNKRNENQPGS